MTEPIRLLQFTDPHLFADRGATLREVCTYDTVRTVLAQAREDHWPADAILVTGDIAQDESREAYYVFREIFEDTGVPVYCLPGNHDNFDLMSEVLTSEPFQLCGHFRIGRWLVPMLNTQRPGKSSGRLSDGELARLDALASENPDHHLLVAMHHHPVPSRSTWLDTVALRNPEALFEIIDRHPNIRCLLWGHIHQLYDQRRGPLLLLATPSTGSQFAPRSEKFALDESRGPAYRWLELYDDGTIATAVNWCESVSTIS